MYLYFAFNVQNHRKPRFYDYFEELPKTAHQLGYLANHIKERKELVDPKTQPEQEFDILGVNNIDGVFANETLLGSDIKQKYKRVYAGDLVYNPHRVNVGSLGIVPQRFDGKYVPSIYVVFYSTNPEKVPPELIHSLLRSPMYKRIIDAYDTRHGAVRANLTFEMLGKIKIPLLDDRELSIFSTNKSAIQKAEAELEHKRHEMQVYMNGITSRGEN